MASRDWLGLEVVDALVVTNAALERVHSTAHVEAIRKLATSEMRARLRAVDDDPADLDPPETGQAVDVREPERRRRSTT